MKNRHAKHHAKDLAKVFEYLHKVQMKLNLEKCTFGVPGGKFLGFLVTRRGIEVNPDQVRAIIEMKAPTRVKEVQRLTGRIAALSRFLPKAGDKCHPFFKLIKSRQTQFLWDDVCDQAFQDLKEFLQTPLVMSKP